MQPHPDHESVFGDTYHGVPSPFVPHRHPWPTRYHGPYFMTPMAVSTYKSSPWYKAGKRPGISGSPDGLGAILETPSISGSVVADALIGGIVGVLAAPQRNEAAVHGLAGAIVVGLFGLTGMGGLLGYELFRAHREGQLDSVIGRI